VFVLLVRYRRPLAQVVNPLKVTLDESERCARAETMYVSVRLQILPMVWPALEAEVAEPGGGVVETPRATERTPVLLAVGEAETVWQVGGRPFDEEGGHP